MPRDSTGAATFSEPLEQEVRQFGIRLEDAERYISGRRRISDEEWVELGRPLSDEEFFAEFTASTCWAWPPRSSVSAQYTPQSATADVHYLDESGGEGVLTIHQGGVVTVDGIRLSVQKSDLCS